MESMAVEVLRKNGAYYKAYVNDVSGKRVSVAFQDNWLPESSFAFHLVRLAAPEDQCLDNFKEGEEIEVSSRFNENEYIGWRNGIIKMMKGNFLVVQYTDWEDYQEIIPLDRIRHKNPNPSITKKTFIKIEIQVPQELQEYSQKENIYKGFQESIGAPICRYIHEKGVLSIISRDERSKKNAMMLKDILFKNIHQKLILQKMTEETQNILALTKSEDIPVYTEEFVASKDMIMLSLRTNWINVQKAEKMKEITNITIDQGGKFKICGRSKEAVKKARTMMEFTQESIQVEKDLIYEVIDTHCQTLQYIVDQSGVVSIKIIGEDEVQPNVQPLLASEEKLVTLDILGTVESIASAKFMLGYHLSHLKDVEQLKQEVDNIKSEIHTLQGHNVLSSMKSEAQKEKKSLKYSGDGGQRRGGQSKNRGPGDSNDGERCTVSNNQTPDTDGKVGGSDPQKYCCEAKDNKGGHVKT